jgi:hypothetical protein
MNAGSHPLALLLIEPDSEQSGGLLRRSLVSSSASTDSILGTPGAGALVLVHESGHPIQDQGRNCSGDRSLQQLRGQMASSSHDSLRVKAMVQL